eukprot:692178-Hanusia_phi.AAC.1
MSPLALSLPSYQNSSTSAYSQELPILFSDVVEQETAAGMTNDAGKAEPRQIPRVVLQLRDVHRNILLSVEGETEHRRPDIRQPRFQNSLTRRER